MTGIFRTAVLAGVVFGRWAFAAEPNAAGVEFFEQKIRPLLAGKCYECHSAAAKKSKGGLRLDTRDALLKGGDSGPALVPGKPDESLLIKAVRHADGLEMPPKSKLPEAEVADMIRWVASGAPDPRTGITAPAGGEHALTEADRNHWSFRPPVRAEPPAVKDAAWPVNAVDRFLLSELEARGIKPAREAPKSILLRRVFLDLIGLPPTRAEIAAFEADRSPDAYEKVVDRLLASPQYGQRWARHWMDIWRFSDWWGLGAEIRNSQKHMWHWRDWIVDSLNADKGYDQLVREMLAADELYPGDLDRLRAGGFLARQYFRFNRNTWMDETVEHTSKAFLGLTLNCTKCHEHKFDPIPQVAYYRFRAFFEPYQVRMDQLPGETDPEKDGLPRPFDCNLEAPTYLFVRGEDKNPVTSKPLTPGIPEVLSFGELKITPVTLPAEAQQPGLRRFVLENHLRDAEKRITSANAELDRAKKALAEAGRRGGLAAGVGIGASVSARPKTDKTKAAPPETSEQARAALAVAEKALAAAEAQPAALRARAAADQAKAALAMNAKELARAAARTERVLAAAQAEEELAKAELEQLRAAPAGKGAVEKKVAAAKAGAEKARKSVEGASEDYTPLRGSLKTPESNVETEASRNKPFPGVSTGRRSALAAWLTDRRNPLTARVAVNHMWARHFGKPLVATVFDFGRNGARPTNQAVLDWLAVDLMEHGWNMKPLHRMMVTSRAYRMSSSNAANSDADRAADPENKLYRRMNPVRMDAQIVRDSLLHLAGELDLSLGGPAVRPGDDVKRRSLYFFHSNNEFDQFLAVFDDPGVLDAYLRSESIVPQQALALTNSKLVQSASAKIAVRLTREAGSPADSDFVRAAFEALLAGRPTSDEQAECEKVLGALTESRRKAGQADPAAGARAALVRALLNHNDFVTIR